MSLTQALLIMLAGVAAGTINTIVGSGTLVTFPTLLTFGYPPVGANISNSLGLVAGGVSGSWGYRSEVSDARQRLRQLAPMSFLGAVAGALLLIWLPASAFKAIVPVLILVGIVLVLIGPWLQRRAAAAHHDEPGEHAGRGRLLLSLGVFGAGVYGGYFGAAQGVLLMGLMSALMTDPLQRINGIKNVLGTVVNAVAALTFLVVAFDKVHWDVAGLIALGSLIGGLTGAGVGRRLPPWALRAFIVVVGLVAIWQLLAG
ncbi:sulfite exporter TauE/SafE family protein [Flexivirga sp. ID2601S]|uniref:Probable membrane transporter protein n=1 Tax=Flexivirga aerilata TaxID=1656889 RepID=A0A849AS14_9MICO|nr:sulfite exporter TauE/SafE family protein [Flexivirga aerilata]NNG41070.1 sulfite exporter TauE/SafE family protein [Flexivirga aerilata]